MYKSAIRPSPATFTRRRHANARGMTLLEVMVSLFLISTLVLIVCSSVLVGKRAASQHGLYAQAISIAQHKIDQMRAVSYGRVWNAVANKANFTDMNDTGIVADTPTALPFALPNGTNHSEGYNDFADTDLCSPSGTVNVVQLTGYTNTVQVTVTIKWKARPTDTKESQLTLTGIITNAE